MTSSTFVLGGGCFWCIDAVMRMVIGVESSVAGYAGGATDNPSYYSVAGGMTGHAEVVKVGFNESVVSPDDLLDLFFHIHDPTTLNRQGNDLGTHYRSIMLYSNNTQKNQYLAAIDRADKIYKDPILTEIKPLDVFYVAEDEHQDYFNKNPAQGYCSYVVAPKISKAQKDYSHLLK